MGSVAWFRRQSSRVLLFAGLTSASCSILVDKNRVQCASNDDCAGFAAGAVCMDAVCQPDPVWGCLGSVVFPPPPPGPFTVTIHMRDLITGAAIPGVVGRLCEKLDTTCAAPIAADVDAGASGDLMLPVPGGFAGYVEMRAPDKMPGIYFFNPPVDGNREIPSVPLMEQSLVEQLAQLNQKQLDLQRGHLLMGGYDCRHMAAAGMKLSADDTDGESSDFYVLNNVPRAGAKSTDLSGRGGFINLKAGIVAITASLAADDRKVATVSLYIRPGTITYTSIVPSP
jgi:hypothetical protein